MRLESDTEARSSFEPENILPDNYQERIKMLDLEMTSDTRAISKSFNSSTSSTSTVKLKTPPGDLTARLGLELSDTKQIPSRSPSPLPSAAKRNIFDTENKVC